MTENHMTEKYVVELKQIFRTPEQYMEQNIEVQGWIRNIRVSKKFGFIELNDGSFFQILKTCANWVSARHW